MKKIDWHAVKRRINFELTCALIDLDPFLDDHKFQLIVTIISAVVGSVLATLFIVPLFK